MSHRRSFLAAGLAIVVALTLALPAVPAAAYVPEKTPRRAVEAQARRTLATPVVRAAHGGVLVRRGARDLFALNADQALTPASVMKLVTTLVALQRFGPGHRFETRVAADRRAATLPRLYLIGGGDPTLATREYVRERFMPDPDDEFPQPAFPNGSPTIEDLASAIRRAGVRRVGDIVVDDSLFDNVRAAPGWVRRYLGPDADTGLLTALTINEGRADHERGIIFSDPSRATGLALAEALERAGVAVSGQVSHGRAPERVAEVASVQSPTLGDIVFYTNRWSMNYPAELMLKGLGARFGRGGSTAAGVGVVVETLRRLKIPLDGLQMADGSGLSTLNRLAPRTVAAIVEHALRTDTAAMRAFRRSFPTAGEPGTLVRRMRGSPVGGNLRGKTGYIRGVRAMAGWVTGADGIPVVYVAIFNRSARALRLTAPIDRLASSLATYPG